MINKIKKVYNNIFHQHKTLPQNRNANIYNNGLNVLLKDGEIYIDGKKSKTYNKKIDNVIVISDGLYEIKLDNGKIYVDEKEIDEVYDADMDIINVSYNSEYNYITINGKKINIK
ncbi:hypothetical protein FPHOBKDP_00180 [Listeria phage LPJP1]|nr:hypothetical protein FPHOBKDP_00180 [Listeria phage LPJP1]